MYLESKIISEDPIEELMSKMTLAEKIGQMTQITLETVSKRKHSTSEKLELDDEALRTALLEFHVGSIINVYSNAMSFEDWNFFISKIQDVACKESRLGIPVIYGIDAVHGANYMLGGTVFPQNLNLAATWNRELVRDIARVTACELIESGIHWNFAPVLDLGRHPMWSRFSETFGEDSYLTTELGRENILGQQNSGYSVAACAKHFLGYGQAHTGRDRTPVLLPDRVVRELYLPPFSEAVKSGVATVMVNSGELNGRPVHADYRLLTNLLRDELGFEGVIVSDWEDVEKLHTIHRVADSSKDATLQAVRAGLDMSMTPFTFEFSKLLKELVEEGLISERRIDESVRRILNLKRKLGLLPRNKDEFPETIQEKSIHIPSQEERVALNLESARQSMVLLKNQDDLLPLKPGSKIVLDGPASTSLPMIHGSWTYTWQGADASAYPDDISTIATAFASRFRLQGKVSDIDPLDHDVDPIVLCIGEIPSVEKPGDVNDLDIDKAQHAFVHDAILTGRPVILVLFAGRPRLLKDLSDKVAAIIWAGQPGPCSGRALADLLDGSFSPSGRLPFTYPKHSAVFHTYDHKWADKVGADYGLGQSFSMDGFDPAWEFGSGLSYTRVSYEALDVQNTVSGLDVFITIRNHGSHIQRENLLLFVSDEYASITPAVKKLRRFESIVLDAGTERIVQFALPRADLMFVDEFGKWVFEPGSFKISVGDLSKIIFVGTQIGLDPDQPSR